MARVYVHIVCSIIVEPMGYPESKHTNDHSLVHTETHTHPGSSIHDLNIQYKPCEMNKIKQEYSTGRSLLQLHFYH